MAGLTVRAARTLFTDRAGGGSAEPFDGCNLARHVGDEPAAVAANRRRLADRIGLPAQRLVFLDQVHGDRVAVVGADGVVTGPADAAVTAVPGLALAVLVADCVPVLLTDARGRAVGVAHAGRRGAALGVAVRAVEALGRLGCPPRDLCAWLGPAVCPAHYEVPARMRDDVEARLPGSATVTAAGTPALDLRAGLERQLRAAGVAEVRRVGGCTAEDPGLYSYRRDGTTGRFAGVAWLTD